MLVWLRFYRMYFGNDPFKSSKSYLFVIVDDRCVHQAFVAVCQKLTDCVWMLFSCYNGHVTLWVCECVLVQRLYLLRHYREIGKIPVAHYMVIRLYFDLHVCRYRVFLILGWVLVWCVYRLVFVEGISYYNNCVCWLVFACLDCDVMNRNYLSSINRYVSYSNVILLLGLWHCVWSVG